MVGAVMVTSSGAVVALAGMSLDLGLRGTVQEGYVAPPSTLSWATPPVGAVLAALALLLGGIVLILVGATGIGRRLLTSPSTSPIHDARQRPAVLLTGEPPEHLSRGLWLVKWILVIPHAVVLIGLGIAFGVTTIAAGIVIVVSGRYPAPLFAFNVSVLRWSWRVGFYAYSALGTDVYPPFSFGRPAYPADLEIRRPERLSRGLVLVKWWLLAVPHYVLLAALTGGTGIPLSASGTGDSRGLSVLTVLVLVAGFMVLFTRHYPSGTFDFVMGANRWAYRVAAYVGLMRDEYPPFRLDQGPHDPGAPALADRTSTTLPAE